MVTSRKPSLLHHSPTVPNFTHPLEWKVFVPEALALSHNTMQPFEQFLNDLVYYKVPRNCYVEVTVVDDNAMSPTLSLVNFALHAVEQIESYDPYLHEDECMQPGKLMDSRWETSSNDDASSSILPSVPKRKVTKENKSSSGKSPPSTQNKQRTSTSSSMKHIETQKVETQKTTNLQFPSSLRSLPYEMTTPFISVQNAVASATHLPLGSGPRRTSTSSQYSSVSPCII